MNKLIIFCVLTCLCFSCQVKPDKIIYGEDVCSFCSMTIVEKTHAAELVTKKGKVFKFDAAECLIHHLSSIDTTTVALFLVTDYETPEKLIDATSATFIVTPEIPSPMRANLTALSSKESAVKLQQLKQGDLFSWQEIQQHLKN